MQCFQKDPNLRVTAKKLLKHPWIVGCRRSDAPVSRKPADFNQAVEEVKQWNKALKSSETVPRASSSGSDGSSQPSNGHPVSRFGSTAVEQQRSNFVTPAAKRPLNITTVTKSRPNPEAFRSPEIADDDNWDNDFATSISPSALHLPHLKPQDYFGGKLSADRLKQFASIDETTARDNWDEHFEGDFKNSRQFFDQDPQEQTIRPMPRRSSKSTESSKSQHGHKKSRSKQSSSSNVPLLHKSTSKPSLTGNNNFELPQRPEMMYREQSSDDFSDLIPESDGFFAHKANRAVAIFKVSWNAPNC